MSYLDQWLLLTVVQTTLLLGSAVVISRLIPLSPMARHSLGVSAIAVSCFAPVLSFVLPPTLSTYVADVTPSALASPSPAPARAVTTIELSPSSASLIEPDTVAMDTVANSSLPNALPRDRTWRSQTAQSSMGQSLDVTSLLLAAWWIGSCVVVCRRYRAWASLREIRKSTVPLPVPGELHAHLQSIFGSQLQLELFSSDRVGGPCVIGWRRCQILLPAALEIDGDGLKQVLTHECAHIHRRDSLILLLQQLASIVLWWQPLMRCVNFQVAAAREAIADMYVTSSSDALSYAETLLEIAERCTNRPALTSLALLQSRMLEQRIQDILDNNYSLQRSRHPSTVLLTALLTMVIVFCCGGVASRETRLVAQDKPAVTTASSVEPGNREPLTADVAPPAPVQANPVQANPVQANPVQANPVQANPVQANPVQAEPTLAEDTRIASGKVVDERGIPVANCRIVFDSRDVIDHVIKPRGASPATTTDEQGNFSLRFPKEYQPYSLTYVWFYKQGHALKGVSFDGRLRANERLDDVRIVLQAATPVTVRVQDPQGAPAKGLGMDVATYCVSILLKTDTHQGPDAIVPVELQQALRVVTDDQGQAILNAFDPAMLRGLRIETPEYGAQSIAWPRRGSSLNVRLLPTCPVIGQIQSPEPGKFAGTEFLLVSRQDEQNEPGAIRYATARAIANDKGQFDVPAIACGELSIVVRHWPHKQEVLPVAPTRANMVAGQATRVKIELVKSIELMGKVVLDDTGSGAENVMVSSANSLPDPTPVYPGRNLIYFDTARTDAQGEYRLYTLAGPTRIRCTTLGPFVSQYDRPADSSVQTVPMSVATYACPTLALRRIPKVEIRLSSLANQPVTDQKLILAAEIEQRVRYVATLTTDGSGAAPLPVSVWSLFEDPRIRCLFFTQESFNEAEPNPDNALRIVSRESNVIRLQK